MRISDWSSDVCSSDLYIGCGESGTARRPWDEEKGVSHDSTSQSATAAGDGAARCSDRGLGAGRAAGGARNRRRSGHRRHRIAPALDRSDRPGAGRSEEHTSELQSLMRISYAVFCLKKKKNKQI